MALSDKIAGAGLVRRVLSALVLAPPCLAAVYYGSPWFELMLALAAVEMAREWARLCDNGRAMPTAAILAAGSIVAIGLASRVGMGQALLAVIAAAALAFVVVLPRGRGVATWLAVGAPVVALPCLAFVWLRFAPEQGRELCFWLLAAVWATDIGA